MSTRSTRALVFTFACGLWVACRTTEGRPPVETLERSVEEGCQNRKACAEQGERLYVRYERSLADGSDLTRSDLLRADAHKCFLTGCSLGEPWSCQMAGVIWGQMSEPELAAAAYQRACFELSRPPRTFGCERLSKLWTRKAGPSASILRRRALERGCYGRELFACVELGAAYVVRALSTKQGLVRVTTSDAERHLDLACGRGDASACGFHAMMQWASVKGAVPNREKALRGLRIACDANQQYACDAERALWTTEEGGAQSRSP